MKSSYSIKLRLKTEPVTIVLIVFHKALNLKKNSENFSLISTYGKHERLFDGPSMFHSCFTGISKLKPIMVCRVNINELSIQHRCSRLQGIFNICIEIINVASIKVNAAMYFYFPSPNVNETM